MKKAPRRRPSLESLEVRSLPTALGIPWPDAGHLTLSLAPDGTPVSGTSSSLFSTLNARPATAGWQTSVLRSFQSWAVLGNINIGVVADSGNPAGQPGPLQGNAAQGDIRVLARPLSNNVVAIGNGFSPYGAGWSGDVVLNTQAPFGDGTAGTEDLGSALLHEAGHTFGLDDNATDTSSVMYQYNLGGRAAPSASDAVMLQKLYGARVPDASEGSTGNGGVATATTLGYASAPSTAVAVNADLSAFGDVDVYALDTPWLSTAATTVSIKASGLSLLTARFAVTDAFGNAVASATTTDPLRNDLSVTVPASWIGQRYYIRVEAAAGAGVFGIGAYRIAAGTSAGVTQALNAGPASSPVTGGDRVSAATNLTAVNPGTDARWLYSARGNIAAVGGSAYYRVKSGAAGQPNLLVSAWGLTSGGLSPKVDVLDAAGNALPAANARVLDQDGSAATVQVTGVVPNSYYVIKVSSTDTSGARAVGGFALAATFRAAPLTLASVASGALNASQTQDFRTLTVAASQVVHFDFSALGGGKAGDTALKLTIYDSRNMPVFTLRYVNGSAVSSGDVLLAAGTYTVRVVAASRQGTALAPVTYDLRSMVLSDPVGPGPTDTTLTGGSTGGSPAPTYDQNSYLFYGYYATLNDPGANPWMQ